MEIINLMKHDDYLKEYISCCKNEWGEPCDDINLYINEKIDEIKKGEKEISILGLVDKELLGFISLFSNDSVDLDLSPWYSTMYVKECHRNKGYSKILNNALLRKAKNLGYSKLYLKTNLNNFYEKFNAIYLQDYNSDKIYYIEI